MLTIDLLAKIDSIAKRILATLYRGLDWVDNQYEARLVDAAYRVIEAKAAAISKAEKDYDATVRAANDKLGVEVDG